MSDDGAVGVQEMAAAGDTTARAPLPALTYPALYEAADAASLAGQQGYKWLVVADLGLLGAAAAISLASQILPLAAARWPLVSFVVPLFEEGWSRAIAAVLLAVAFVAKYVNRQRGFDAQWFDGRAVAETVKSATWRYAMGAPPFIGNEKAHAAFVDLLRETIKARVSLMPHLHHLPPESRQTPRCLDEIRAASLASRRALYVEERLENQALWYAGKAEANSRSASRWFWAGMAAQLAALVVAIALIVMPKAPDVVAVFTTFAAAIAAWTQFRRHDELSKSYSLAAHELAFLRAEVEDAASERAFRKAVNDTESAISREHTMWMAKRG